MTATSTPRGVDRGRFPGREWPSFPRLGDDGVVSAHAVDTPFGSSLRRWRSLGRLSQLELAHRAGTTPRHLSFLETGRSRPTRGMVARLAEALALPLRERNALFTAAGFAPDYPETALEDADLAPFRAVLSSMLDAHEPFPGFVIDGHWTVLHATPAAAALLPPEPASRNLVELMFAGAWRELIDNWADIAQPVARRLQRESAARPADERLAELADLARGAAGIADTPAGLAVTSEERVLCPHFRWGERVIRTVSVAATFGQPLDVTLDELRVELFFPLDAEAEQAMRDFANAV